MMGDPLIKEIFLTLAPDSDPLIKVRTRTRL